MSDIKIRLSNIEIPVLDNSLSSILLNFTIGDVRDPSKKTGSYSEDIKLPACTELNDIYSHAYVTRLYPDEAKAKLIQDAAIIQDGIVIFEGECRLRHTAEFNGAEYYLLNFNSEISTWYDELSKLKLSDLPFPDINFTNSEITASWDRTGIDEDYVWPPISYGQTSEQGSFKPNDFRPGIFTKAMFRRALSETLGYRISSDFYDSEYFDRLFLSYGGAFAYSDEDIKLNTFKAVANHGSNTVILNTSAQTPGRHVYNQIPFNDDTSGAGGFDYNNNYDQTLKRIQIDKKGSIGLRISFNLQAHLGSLLVTDAPLWIALYKDGSFFKDIHKDVLQFSTSADIDKDILIDNFFYFNEPTSYYEVKMSVSAPPIPGTIPPPPGTPMNISVYLKDGSYIENIAPAEIRIGETVAASQVIDKQTAVSDYIMDIFRLHNIYSVTDIKRKIIYFEPRDSFYYPVAQGLDWTDKLDLLHPITKNQLTNEYSREIKFKFVNDSKDEFVKDWETRNRDSYQSESYELQEAFKRGTETIETKVLPATSMVRFKTRAGTWVYTPQLWGKLQQGQDLPPFSTDFKPRLLYYAGHQTLNWHYNGAQRSDFPYAYSVDLLNTGSQKALSWCNYDDTEKGLVTQHWANFFKNVDSGHILIAKFYLTPTDIAGLDFRKPIWVKDGWYVLNEIRNYNPAVRQSVEVELFKYFPTEPAVITKSRSKFGDITIDVKPGLVPSVISGTVTADNGDDPTVITRDYTKGSIKINNGSGNSTQDGQGQFNASIGGNASAPFQVLFGAFPEANTDTYFAVGAGNCVDDEYNALELKKTTTVIDEENSSFSYDLYVDGAKVVTESTLPKEFTWQGGWDPLVSYSYADVVNMPDGTYYAIADAIAGTPTTDTAFWVKLGGYGDMLKSDNLSGLTNYATARTNLGLGTMAVQNAVSVSITGGAIDGTTVGATTAATVRATTVTVTGLTAGRVPYVSTAGLIADSASFTWDNANTKLFINGKIYIRATTTTANNAALVLSPVNTTSQYLQYIRFTGSNPATLYNSGMGMDDNGTVYIASLSNYTTFAANRITLGGDANAETTANITAYQTQPVGVLVKGTVTATGTDNSGFADGREINVVSAVTVQRSFAAAPTLTSIATGYVAYRALYSYTSSTGSAFIYGFSTEATYNLTGTNTSKVVSFRSSPTITAMPDFNFTGLEITLNDTKKQYGVRVLGKLTQNEFDGTIKVGRLTSTERDALTNVANGMIFYNTTTDKLQVRAAGAWVDLH